MINYELGFNIEKLIVVPGHACFKQEVDGVPKNLFDENNWILQSFQKGEVRFYLEHINTALDIASKNNDSLLVFSGGFTRNGCGKWSESLTYATIAENKCVKCTGGDCTVPKRIALEESGLDSLQNLEFSKNLYRNIVGREPNNTIIVGWKFKEERFNLHRETLGIPKSKFEYVGVNNPLNLEDAKKGERKTLDLFLKDRFGISGELGEKRFHRDVRQQICV